MSGSGVNYSFLKGHGTENDFVLLPDPDGTIHGDLSAARVQALCDRRAGIGADGVLRVVRSQAMPGGDAFGGTAEWFMDYRNADGSISEMCGNGIRLFARYLVDHDLASQGKEIPIGTRDGVKSVVVDGAVITVDMGVPEVLGESVIGLGKWSWPARHVSMGNPHAVVFVDSLDEVGRSRRAEVRSRGVPEGRQRRVRRIGAAMGTSRCVCTSGESAKRVRVAPVPAQRSSPLHRSTAMGRARSMTSMCPAAG